MDAIEKLKVFIKLTFSTTFLIKIKNFYKHLVINRAFENYVLANVAAVLHLFDWERGLLASYNTYLMFFDPSP